MDAESRDLLRAALAAAYLALAIVGVVLVVAFVWSILT